ncbi:D-threonate 4-phosphate dehydrogenase [soil metagenome]
MLNPSLLIITSGDRDGVGLEISIKALNALGPQKGARFILACSTDPQATRELRNLKRFGQITITAREASLEAASRIFSDLEADEILIWRDGGNEAAWVKSAATLALMKEISGIVTGPVSKGRFKKLSSRFMGHTGLLSALAKVPVQQGYVGKNLGVVLATDHVALRDVEKNLSTKVVARAIANAKTLSKLMPASLRKRPIAVLGLNPHAGENGLIGKFERRLKLPHGVVGPVPADTAFTEGGRSKYGTVVAMYHDQGLIPFKLLHGQDSGFQVSLGLPFVRTSVDHGTARDIAGLGLANPGSMIDAIRGAMTLSKAPSKGSD